MGKKKQHRKRFDDGDDELPSSAFDRRDPDRDGDGDDDGMAADENGERGEYDGGQGFKHDLYQRAVQTPRGEISYMLKFFLSYIGGRMPLHFREDFCGTALICAEWVRGDARRTAIGVDLDDDALSWGLENNVSGGRGDFADRVHLFHQNVLHPLGKSEDGEDKMVEQASDIVCALNFSCCCLHERKDLVAYFQQALSSISTKGGVFVMDLYGGISSEQALRIRRRYSDFTYTWEQEEFDIVNRRTTISLHFQLTKSRRVIRNAFSYHWRLWTIPEVCDCLREAGFDSTHPWLCEMPEIDEKNSFKDMDDGREARGEYEEVERFKQCDAWNAYIVGVKRPVHTKSAGPSYGSQ